MLQKRINFKNSNMSGKQRIIITISLILLLSVIGIMVYDFIYQKNLTQDNPYEYDISNLRKVDSSLVDYHRIMVFDTGMENARAIAIDKNDHLFVTGDNMLVRMTTGGAIAQVIPIKDTGYCIAVGENERIYLGTRSHIEIWETQGKQQSAWEPVNEQSFLTSIAVHDNSVFVADAGNRIVYHYNREGNLMGKIGKKDSLQGIPGFIIPSGYFDLLIDNHDMLWVVNPGRHAFEAYDFEGNLVSSWHRTSMKLEGFSGCCNPSHIAVLSNGNFVTSEKGLERVKIHLPTGDFKCVVAGPEEFEVGTKGMDLAVDSEDNIYVLDPVRNKILVYQLKEK